MRYVSHNDHNRYKNNPPYAGIFSFYCTINGARYRFAKGGQETREEYKELCAIAEAIYTLEGYK